MFESLSRQLFFQDVCFKCFPLPCYMYIYIHVPHKFCPVQCRHVCATETILIFTQMYLHNINVRIVYVQYLCTFVHNVYMYTQEPGRHRR